MASNDEKPNLRPTKRTNAHGKSLFLHHNPHQPSNQSYIHATWNATQEQDHACNSAERDPLGIHQPNIRYSLNKQQRWKRLDSFQREIAHESSSSSDDDLRTQSDPERRDDSNSHRRKYRLYKFHNNEQKTNCVEITSNTGEQRTQTPRKTYMQKTEKEISDGNSNADVTYIAVVPPPRDKHLANIRKHHNIRSKKTTASTQRAKFTQIQERLDLLQQLKDDSDSSLTDEDESRTSYYTSVRSDKLKLNDFIPIDQNEEMTKIEHITTTSEVHLKPSPIYLDEATTSEQMQRYHRQVTREEPLHKRDRTRRGDLKAQNVQTNKPKAKSSHHLMSLSFRNIFLHATDFTSEYLSQTYGGSFLQANCYPTRYLICLTDRLNALHWSNHSDNPALSCYLVIVLNEEINDQTNICRGQVALNMDLYSDTIEIESLAQSEESVYDIATLVEQTVQFIKGLEVKTFKTLDPEINQRKIFPNKPDSRLSEGEFINQHIYQIQSTSKEDSKTNVDNDLVMEEYACIRPEICTNCCSDMNEFTPMTALKSCGHWLCNQCWKQYLESSVKSIKIILCPEWNCCSIVDVGTMLSLVNVRCMNIYERNVERCLVNITRSYVKCPSKGCPSIVPVLDRVSDSVRCRCGHQFCIKCKEEPHFPARCTSYLAYISEARRLGDLVVDNNPHLMVRGRHCISCNNFIEKNGGCNHMTCRCGAEFCWLCTAYWKDHYTSTQEFRCPRREIFLEKKLIRRERNFSRTFYETALYHRHERSFSNQVKQNDNAKRLIGTIPLEKHTLLDSSLLKTQIDKREALLRHSFQMVKYINHLHSVCEFIAVAADGYAQNPKEFVNSLYPLQALLFNLSQVLEGGRGYRAIEQMNDLHERSEKLIEQLRQAVIRRNLRESNPTGYITT